MLNGSRSVENQTFYDGLPLAVCRLRKLLKTGPRWSRRGHAANFKSTQCHLSLDVIGQRPDKRSYVATNIMATAIGSHSGDKHTNIDHATR